MGPLTRRAPKLLSTVGGKTHATADDHHDPVPSRPPLKDASSNAQHPAEDDDEDINRDPESTDDELPTAAFTAPRYQANSAKVNKPAPKFRAPPSADLKAPTSNTYATFKKPNAPSPKSLGSKRSSPTEPPSSDNAEDDMIFSSQTQSSQPKRKKTGKATANIHAAEPGSAFRDVLYGKKARKRTNASNKLQMPRAMTSEQATRFSVQGSGATFSKTSVPEIKTPAPEVKFQTRAVPEFKTGMNTAELDSRSSSPELESLPSSPGIQEIHSRDLSDSLSYISKVDCDICGDRIPKSLRQDFEDQFNGGKRLTYKWRDRFCRYHKQQQAKELWTDRGYPDIDWDNFRARLKKSRHSGHLKDILSGDVQSTYRNELEQVLKGRYKTLMQNLRTEDKKQNRVGYYGPRGEKLMTEHIISYFGDQLRNTATRDRLVAAAGVSGGVSGYVQAVLVPELAVSLVLEDLKTDRIDQVAKVIAESGELGELLHPENEDRVKEPEMLHDI